MFKRTQASAPATGISTPTLNQESMQPLSLVPPKYPLDHQQTEPLIALIIYPN